MTLRGLYRAYGASPQVQYLPSLSYRSKAFYKPSYVHQQKPSAEKPVTPVNSRFSATQKLFSLLKDMNVDLRKVQFSLGYYLQKTSEAEAHLNELIRASCFMFLLADLRCDLRVSGAGSEEVLRREQNHYAPREKMRVIKAGIAQARPFFESVQAYLDRIEDEIIGVEDQCAALNQESMALLGGLGVVGGF